MPPVFDSATSGIATGSSGFSITHVVGSNSNRAVVASVGSSTGAGARTCTGATYNGVALQEMIERTDAGTGDMCLSGHMTTAEPASGSHSFAFTLSGAGDEVGAAVADYHDVNQTTPHGTAVANDGNGGTSSSGAVSSAANELVFGAAYIGSTIITPAGGQTQRFEDQGIGSFASHNGCEKAGAGSVTLQWTHDAGIDWVAWAVPIKEVVTVTATLTGSAVDGMDESDMVGGA